MSNLSVCFPNQSRIVPNRNCGSATCKNRSLFSVQCEIEVLTLDSESELDIISPLARGECRRPPCCHTDTGSCQTFHLSPRRLTSPLRSSRHKSDTFINQYCCNMLQPCHMWPLSLTLSSFTFQASSAGGLEPLL